MRRFLSARNAFQRLRILDVVGLPLGQGLEDGASLGILVRPVQQVRFALQGIVVVGRNFQGRVEVREGFLVLVQRNQRAGHALVGVEAFRIQSQRLLENYYAFRRVIGTPKRVAQLDQRGAVCRLRFQHLAVGGNGVVELAAINLRASQIGT